MTNKHQSNQMRASITGYGFWTEEEEKKETDNEVSDNTDDDN